MSPTENPSSTSTAERGRDPTMQPERAPEPATDPNVLALEEGLDALLTRVRWYTVRRVPVPTRVAYAFNRLCDILGKPDEAPWTRVPLA